MLASEVSLSEESAIRAVIKGRSAARARNQRASNSATVATCQLPVQRNT